MEVRRPQGLWPEHHWVAVWLAGGQVGGGDEESCSALDGLSLSTCGAMCREEEA